MGINTPLFEKLQKEFCPPLDPALVAAILGDFSNTKPTDAQEQEIVDTLRSLAAQAIVDESQDTDFSFEPQTSDASDGFEYSDSSSDDTSFSPTDTSSSSATPHDYAFTTPMGFLQTILPGVSPTTLKKALRIAGISGEQDAEIDLWDVIANILTSEYIREMEERGLEGLEEAEEALHPRIDDDWTVVGSNGKSTKATAKPPPKRSKSATTKVFTLGDVRQQHRTGPPASFDPWAKVSSVCSHLSLLIPCRDPSFFASYFHSPSYGTPYEALCTALSSITPQAYAKSDDNIALSQTLLEVLLPAYDNLDSEQRDRLTHDIELALRATNGAPEQALDLARLLRELDDDYNRGNGDRGMGIYHLPKVAPSSPPISAKQPTFPPPVPPPLATPPSPTQKKVVKNPSAWQTVPVRATPQPHRLALSIPAYRGANGKGRTGVRRGPGNTDGKGGKGDVGELYTAANPARRQYMHKRDELLRQAAKMWQKGNVRTRGGEVAQYYADRAREFQELAKKEALNAAREDIEVKRLSTPKQDTIDLHGTTIAEAVVIVKDTLQWYGSSPVFAARPSYFFPSQDSQGAGQKMTLSG
ncbi:hypothetical protein ONZ45_g16440 [Pleurotus djamor]|nr:hypothetical protein ONZ45_g16440 [Pleurotus djamor]